MKTCAFILFFLLVFESHLFAGPAVGKSPNDLSTGTDDDKDGAGTHFRAAYFRGVFVRAQVKAEQTEDMDDDKQPQTIHLLYTFDAQTPANGPLVPIITFIAHGEKV